MFVHFPIALLIVSLLFDGIGFSLKKDHFNRAGLYTLIVGWLGAAVAVVTGLMAEDGVVEESLGTSAQSIVEHLVERHETFALLTLGLFAVILGWRLLRPKTLGRSQIMALYTVVSLVGFASLVYTGYLGGHLAHLS